MAISDDQDMDPYPVLASVYKFDQKSPDPSSSGFLFKKSGNDFLTQKI
jgi:hypothetical protein